jgi:hypothetical protein
MKKLFLILSVFLIVYSATAQKIGLKIGLNMATIKSDQPDFDEYKKSLIGVNGGLILEKKVVPYLSLQGEVLFSQKGFYDKKDEGNYEKKIVNYLEVPLSVKIKVGPTPLFFLAGPYFGYAMNGKIKSKQTVLGVSTESDDDIDWDTYKMKRFDLGINAGLGMKFGPIFIEGRYGLGLTDLNDDSNESYYYKNSVFGVSVGVIF